MYRLSADPVGEATGTAGGDGVRQVDPAVAVEHDRFTGLGIDRRDEHRSLRPALTGQPRGDGGAPLRLPGTVRRRIHVECRRAHPAAHVSRILGGGDDLARSLQVVRHRPVEERVLGRIRPDRSVAGARRHRMAASSSVGVAPASWAAAVEPADVPMVRSAVVTSSPASNRPAMTPISHALPVDPPPPRTNARSPAAGTRVVASTCG